MTDTTALGLYEAVSKSRTRAGSSGQRKLVHAQPKSAEEIAEILKDRERYPSPVRPFGSGSAVTRCAQTPHGTRLDLSLLDRVLSMTSDSVTVQAGIRIRDLAEYLADEGMELFCGCLDLNRTVGGAVSSATLGGSIPGDGSQFASAVEQIVLINGLGNKVLVTQKMPDLLTLTRMSYGLLGVVYSVQLRIRPIQAHTIRTSKLKFDEFAQIIPLLMKSTASVKATLMPFRNKVFVELRHLDEGGQKTSALPWKLRDWTANKALPMVVKSVNKAVPVKKLRDPLIDGFTEATHILNNTLTISGSNAAEQTGRFKLLKVNQPMSQSTWFFPVRNVPALIEAYHKFSLGHYKKAKYRCDLPAEMWRVDLDQYALLSPSFNESMYALNLRTADMKGWDNYLLEFFDLAKHFEGVPVFNKTRGLSPGYAAEVYGERLIRFCNIRSRLDPQDRLLNQYFAEHL
ncbi:MAG: FAD-binding protein [Gammaproteobacteria bacterium]